MKIKKRRTPQNKKVGLSDWLAMKPYQKATNYDREYLAVARKIHQVLLSYKDFLSDTLTDPMDYIQLSVSITSYLEDVVNDIGIWRVLVESHKELIDSPIPFFVAEDYLEGELNLQDVLFLLFIFFFLKQRLPINPHFLPFVMIAHSVMEILVEEYEYVPETDYYTQLFTLPEEPSFFEVKEKLDFMALDSYLLGLDFSVQYLNDIETFLMDPPGDVGNLEDPSPLLYQMKDPYLFKLCSSFSGLSARDWFGRLVHTSEANKAALLDLDQSINSLFFHEKSDDSYHHFIELGTQMPIKVVAESVNIAPKDAGKVAAMMQLVRWKGKWWMSGAFLAWPVNSLQQAISKLPTPESNFWLNTPEAQESLVTQTEAMYQVFVKTFGKEYVPAWTLEELNQLGHTFFTAYHESLAKAAPNLPPLPNLADELDEADLEMGMGFGFIQGVGMTLIPDLPYYLQLLSADRELSWDEKLELFFFLYVDGMPPQMVPSLLAAHPHVTLSYPVEKSHLDVRAYSDYLLRLLQPEYFGRPLPRLNFL